MQDPKEQKIVILTELNDSDNNLILHGIKIAAIFKKELCLFYNYTKKEKSKYNIIKSTLKDYKKVVKEAVPNLDVSSLIVKGPLVNLLEVLTDEYEAILFLAQKRSFNKLSKNIRESQIPFLFIDTQNPTITDYKKVIVPIDIRKENSDAGLWCSYFGRFNNSEIIAIAANDKLKENIRLVTKNIVLLKKLLTKFKVAHKIFKGKSNSFKVQFEALEYAITSNSDLMIILGSSVITPIDLILGLPENKILKNADQLPIMIVNPRRDMYIMCD